MRESEHLNTPRLVADDTQKTVWKWEQQEPFGAGACNPDPDGDNVQFEFNLRFPGQYFDRETSLHYNYFRDYEPSLGRYEQSDSIGLGGGPNTYSYALQMPLSAIDASGQLPAGVLIAAMGGGAVVGAVTGGLTAATVNYISSPGGSIHGLVGEAVSYIQTGSPNNPELVQQAASVGVAGAGIGLVGGLVGGVIGAKVGMAVGAVVGGIGQGAAQAGIISGLIHGRWPKLIPNLVSGTADGASKKACP